MGDFTIEEAMVLSAARDYKRALIHLKRHPGSDAAQWKIKKLEEFFYSPDFEDLTKIEPNYLIRKMKELVDEEY